MSASTERKNRIAAKADGTHKKTLAAQKEAEKQKKEKTKWTIVGIFILVCFIALVYLNSGMFYRNASAVSVDVAAYEADGVSVAADSVDYSIAEVNYLFNYNYSTFVNQYGSMASYLGLDTSSSLKSQSCMMGTSEEEDYTWYDYFMDTTVSQLKSYAACAAYAEAVGIELSEEDAAEIDSNVESLTASAEEYGYSLKSYLSTMYGKGCNEKVFRDVLEMEYISAAVQEYITNLNDYTAEEITAHYAEIADDYDYFGYSFYLVSAETETDEDGNTSAPTEEAMAAAKASAEEILAKVQDGDLETAVVDVLGVEVVPVSEDTEDTETTEEETAETASTTAVDVQGASVESGLAEWLLSADRQAGDMDVVEYTDLGYYVVIFNGRYTQTEATEESGDVAYCDYISEQDLRSADFSEWNNGFFSALIEGVTTADKFGIRYVG